jgi:nitrite reductase/ring-hydroxylating ferredoxin subunit
VFCSEPCKWLFQREPERYAGHHGVVKRILAGEAPASILQLARTYFGLIRAYEDHCPHLGLPLSAGRLDGERLICTGHHWEYDARTGRGINPATVELTELPVIVEKDAVLVDIAACR